MTDPEDVVKKCLGEYPKEKKLKETCPECGKEHYVSKLEKHYK